jgi:hypothetical protein
MERKLTAILCADVFGYSRLMGEDEEATLSTLSSDRNLIDSLIEQYHGRFVNSAGDSVLAEFASVVNAVQCAVDHSDHAQGREREYPTRAPDEFRIGVNLGRFGRVGRRAVFGTRQCSSQDFSGVGGRQNTEDVRSASKVRRRNFLRMLPTPPSERVAGVNSPLKAGSPDAKIANRLGLVKHRAQTAH